MEGGGNERENSMGSENSGDKQIVGRGQRQELKNRQKQVMEKRTLADKRNINR